MTTKQDRLPIWFILLFCLFGVSAWFLLLGCSTFLPSASFTPSHKPDTLYKFDLVGTINGYNFFGFGVVPKSDSYTIILESQVNVDLFTIDSCHRSFSLPAAIRIGWLTPKKKIEYSYTPTSLELKSGCMLLAGSFTQDESNVSARALFDFEDKNPLFSLPAVVECSGDNLAYPRGVSMCQARAGLVQAIKFLGDVEMAPKGVTDECKLPEPESKSYWIFKIKRGVCTYVFRETARPGPGRMHRLTTIGYDQTRIRGIN